jgi:hypothetical protein
VLDTEAAHGQAHSRCDEGQQRELWSQVGHSRIPALAGAAAIVPTG